MFICERCGSRYSAMHAAAMENCPRCMIRDRIATPLAFKAFQPPEHEEAEAESQSASVESEEPDSTVSV